MIINMKTSKAGILIILLSALLLLVHSYDASSEAVVAYGATSKTDGSQVASELKQHRSLVIMPPPNNPQNLIVKRVGETLNMTCLVKYNHTTEGEHGSSLAEHDPDPRLAWYLPHGLQNSRQRTSMLERRTPGSLTVTVTSLKDTDSGTYECEARTLDREGNFDFVLTNKVEVTVKSKKNSCSETSFACSTGECIPKRFVCDGRSDCKEGSDESPSTCGTCNPCDGKLRCEDGRCMSRQWCCDRSDPNCTTHVTPSCCKQLSMPFNLDASPSTQLSPRSLQSSNMEQFLQFTIVGYAVLGAFMAFLLVNAISKLVIWRVHLRRNNILRDLQLFNRWTKPQDAQCGKVEICVDDI